MTGGTQIVLLVPRLANGKPQSEAKTCKKNSTLSCSSLRWETESRHCFSSCFSAISEVLLLAPHKRERRKALPLFSPFFVHIRLDHLSRVTLASHAASSHPFFTSFPLVLCPHSLALRKV